MTHPLDILKDTLETEQDFINHQKDEINKFQERIYFASQQISTAEITVNNIKDAIIKLGGSVEPD
jgi:hypothetical protein